MTRIWIVLLLLVVACAEPSTPRATVKWIEVRSDHFDLATDMSEPEGRQAVDALEKNRAALLSAGWSDMGDRLSSRLDVVLLKEHTDFTRYFGFETDGLFTARGRPTIWMWGPAQRWGRGGRSAAILRHELTHRIAAAIYARQPRWFAEGLAKFFEALEISEDWSVVRRGYFNAEAFRERLAGRHVHVADVLAWKSYEGLDQSTMWGLYGESWLLVHWLYNEHPDEFTALQRAFIAGTDPDVAWKEVMGRYPLDEIDEALERHARFDTIQITEVPIAAKAFSVRVTPMTDADALGLDARLWLAGAGGAKGKTPPDVVAAARASIDRAFALEPANRFAVDAAVELDWRLSPAEWRRRLEAQLRLRPNDDVAAERLGAELVDERAPAPEVEAAFKRAIALAPKEAGPLNALAWFLLESGRPQDALPYSTKAVLYDATSPNVLDTHAMVLAALGRCREALSLQRRAVDRVSEARGTERELRAHLAAIESTCEAADAR